MILLLAYSLFAGATMFEIPRVCCPTVTFGRIGESQTRTRNRERTGLNAVAEHDAEIPQGFGR